MIVVSNTTPINYLILVEQIHLLYGLYGQVIVPQAVYDELQSAGAPAQVQEWMSNLPHWIEVRTALSPDPTLNLNPGEREAIALAEQLQADGILLDERKARREATRRGLTVTGTLGALETAAKQGLINLPETLVRLQQTSFRVEAALLQALLERETERKRIEGDNIDPAGQ